MRPCNIAVVGATGAVGRVFLEILEQRNFPAKSIRLFASERSAGKQISVNGQPITVEKAGLDSFRDVDIAFISASGDVSRELASLAVRNGALVIDDSSAFRMDPTVPLVVPEVNVRDLESHRGIVSIPNCSTTPLVMVLYALHKVNPVKRVIVDTYQSVSGTGAAAVEELKVQGAQALASKRTEPQVYPHQIAFNLIPHIEQFLDNGYTKEEWKMIEETRKIMHEPDIAISATCVRVPVNICHSEAVHIEFANPILADEARESLSHSPGICVLDEPKMNLYPMPIDAAGKDAVFVGRIRQDASHPKGLALWVVSDNLRKGAALNAIQIAEEILSRELLLAPGRRS